jgi:S-adenosylmethionine hydrolase
MGFKVIITLLTDFGISDFYVGSMKGVILNISPDVQIVDITHDVTSQHIEEAAFVLKRSYAYFPAGTIHVIVVDPGVGSERAILAVQTDRYLFLAPDNGVLKYIFHAHPHAVVYRVTNSSYFLSRVSPTFHGRDIFAPVAAHLSKGCQLDTLGELFQDYIVGNIKMPAIESGGISGEIVYIDKFGNGVTNIEGPTIIDKKNIEVKVKSQLLKGLYSTYTDVAEGEPLILIGSGGTLEISIRGQNASKKMGLCVGDPVTVTYV